MSVVKAFGCDYCGMIKAEIHIAGIDMQMDLFSTHRSLKTNMNPEQTEIHYCVECYTIHVGVPAENFSPRKVSQVEYNNTLQIFSETFKKKCVENYRKKIFFK